MDAINNRPKDLFEENGLCVKSCDVEVGKTYPIYGMITKFINDQPGSIVVELNYGIQAELSVASDNQIEILKERLFESGIFVATY